MRNFVKQVLLLSVLGRIATNGYLDPNTGGMIFQALAAVFATVSGAVLIFSRQIKLWWATTQRKRREKKQKKTNSKS
ncbi:MAG: hypothetical protein ACPG8W_11245 [Candidatus Promineifilaceae bacterium]